MHNKSSKRKLTWKRTLLGAIVVLLGNGLKEWDQYRLNKMNSSAAFRNSAGSIVYNPKKEGWKITPWQIKIFFSAWFCSFSKWTSRHPDNYNLLIIYRPSSLPVLLTLASHMRRVHPIYQSHQLSTPGYMVEKRTHTNKNKKSQNSMIHSVW